MSEFEFFFPLLFLFPNRVSASSLVSKVSKDDVEFECCVGKKIGCLESRLLAHYTEQRSQFRQSFLSHSFPQFLCERALR